MTAITRTLDAGNLSAVASQHTQPVHLVRITIPGGSPVYYSEGKAISFGGNTYLEGMVKVGELAWNAEGEQTCSIEIQNTGDAAETLFFSSAFYNATVDIWLTYVDGAGTNTTPVLYITGGVEGTTLDPVVLKATVVTQKLRISFTPNKYMKAVGFNFIPPDGSVVTWNGGSYVLERET